jgi:hypothetical protein
MLIIFSTLFFPGFSEACYLFALPSGTEQRIGHILQSQDAFSFGMHAITL